MRLGGCQRSLAPCRCAGELPLCLGQRTGIPYPSAAFAVRDAGCAGVGEGVGYRWNNYPCRRGKGGAEGGWRTAWWSISFPGSGSAGSGPGSVRGGWRERQRAGGGLVDSVREGRVRGVGVRGVTARLLCAAHDVGVGEALSFGDGVQRVGPHPVRQHACRVVHHGSPFRSTRRWSGRRRDDGWPTATGCPVLGDGGRR